MDLPSIVTDATMSLSTLLTSSSSAFATSFPSTTLGIPIATVCPLGTDSNIAQAFLPISLPTISLSILTTSIVPASAVLPDGSMTTFSSLTSGEIEAPDPSEVVTTVLPDGTSAIQIDSDGLGRVIAGSDGCQTLYKPSVMAICSTVVTPIGLPAVTITDCDQYITFSSETLFTCAPTPTIVPRPADSASSSSNAGGAVLTRTLPEESLTPPSLSASAVLTQDFTTDTVSTSAAEEGLSNVASDSISQTLITSVRASVSTHPATSVSSPTTQISISPSSPNANPITTKFPLSLNIGMLAGLSRRALSSLTYTTPPTGDVPMSIARHLLPQNQPAYRQVMINKGRPISTDLVTVTPDAAAEMEMEMETVTASADVSMSTMADEIRGRSAIEVVRAIFHRRQIDGDGTVAAAGTINDTLANITIADTNTELSPDLDMDLNIKQADELNLTESLSISVPSVSTPLLPLTVSTPTDNISLDAISSVTNGTLSSDQSMSPLETDTPVSTAVADPSVETIAAIPSSSREPISTSLDISTDIPSITSDAYISYSSIAGPTDTPTMDASMYTLTDIPTPKNDLALLSPPQPTKYYAAPWYQFLPNSSPGIPTNIKGITCRGGLEPIGSCTTPDTDGDTESCECEVHDEIWSVTSLTLTRVGTTSVVFSGSVVVDGGSTTVVSVDQVLTTTATGVVGRVVRRTVTTVTTSSVSMTGSDEIRSVEGEGTVYATLTSYPSVTMTLVPNASGNVSVDGGVGSSSTMDAAMDVNAAMPQGAPSSISTPAGTGTGTGTLMAMLTSTSMDKSISYPAETGVTSVSTPFADTAESTEMDTMIEGTVMVTSIVATETLTIPPGDQNAFGPMPTGMVSSDPRRSLVP